MLFGAGEVDGVARGGACFGFNLKETVPGVAGCDAGGIDFEFFFCKFLELGDGFFQKFVRRLVFRRGVVADAQDILADVGLVSPVVHVLDEEHILAVGLGHIFGKNRLGDGVADGVARGVPAVVGGGGVEQSVSFHQFHQRVVGAVGEVDVDEGDRNAFFVGAFHFFDETERAVFFHAEILERGGFFRIRERGIDGQQEIGARVVSEDAADGRDVLLNRFPNLLAFVARHGVFGAAERVERGENGFQSVVVHVVARDEKERELVGAGEGAVFFRRKRFGFAGEISMLERRLRVLAAVVEA